jgi:hypothetical protein
VFGTFWFWTDLVPPVAFTSIPEGSSRTLTGDVVRVLMRAESQDVTVLWTDPQSGATHRFLVQMDWYPEIRVGQRVSFACLRFHSVRLAEHGTYDAFLRARGLTGTCRSYSVSVLADVSDQYPVTVWLQTANQNLYRRLHQFFPEPYAALIAGVLL